jgi:hypothetical protein
MVTVCDPEGKVLEYLVTPPGCRIEQLVFRDIEQQGISRDDVVVQLDSTKAVCFNKDLKVIVMYNYTRMSFSS